MKLFNQNVKKLVMLFSYLIVPFLLFGQFAEKIGKKCKDLEMDKRVRIAVGSFESTTNRAYGQFAGELATMLSNALVITDCFQVLASTRSNSMQDLQSEKDFNRSGDVNDETQVEEGEMRGAQLIVTGEVTEFNEGKSGVQVGIIKVGQNKANVGFVLQIANPRTRQIIFSESINMEGTSPGGFSGASVFGMPVVGSFKSKAMADAVEKAIIKAVELIVAQKDKIQAMPSGNPEGIERTSVVKVEGVDFVKLGNVTTAVKANPKVKDAIKTLSGGVGTIKVVHTGTFDELADFLSTNIKGFQVVGAEKGQITLKAGN